MVKYQVRSPRVLSNKTPHISVRSGDARKITELQKDYVILDGVEGRGHYVGTYLALTTLERYWYQTAPHKKFQPLPKKEDRWSR